MSGLTTFAKTFGLSRIRKNLVSNGIATVVPGISTLVLTPILLRQLGDQSYGVYIAAMSLVGTLAVLDLGMTSAATKYVAQVDVQEDKPKLNAIISNSFSLYILIGLIVLVFVYIAAPMIGSRIFGETDITTETLVGIVRLIGWVFSLNLLRGAMSGVIRGFQRYEAIAFTQTLYYLLLFVLQVVIVVLGGDVGDLLWVNFFIAAILLAVNIFIVKRYLVTNLKLFAIPDKRIIRELLSFGVFLLVANLGGMMLTSIDKLVIINVLGAATLTYYAVPLQLFVYIHRFGNTFASILFPLTSELQSAQDTQNMRRLYLRSIRLVTLLTTVPTVCLVIFSETVLSVWVSPELAIVSAPIMQVVAIGYLFQYIAIVPYYFLLGTGKVRNVAVTLVTIAVVAITLLYVGMKVSGLVGGAAGMSLGLLLMLIYPMLVQRSMRIQFREVFVQGYGLTLIYSLLCLLILMIVDSGIVIRLGVAFVYLLSITYWGNFQQEDKVFVSATVRSGWQRLRYH
ncbi:MAG TPA: oligosaccharide flippase family protein [Cyclobacteriaceae bacterium]|nr:oligosaccharide flippase family protein [Cyclobacteriaceae bacterium]